MCRKIIEVSCSESLKKRRLIHGGLLFSASSWASSERSYHGVHFMTSEKNYFHTHSGYWSGYFSLSIFSRSMWVSRSRAMGDISLSNREWCHRVRDEYREYHPGLPGYGSCVQRNQNQSRYMILYVCLSLSRMWVSRDRIVSYWCECLVIYFPVFPSSIWLSDDTEIFTSERFWYFL